MNTPQPASFLLRPSAVKGDVTVFYNLDGRYRIYLWGGPRDGLDWRGYKDVNDAGIAWRTLWQMRLLGVQVDKRLFKMLESYMR